MEIAQFSLTKNFIKNFKEHYFDCYLKKFRIHFKRIRLSFLDK